MATVESTRPASPGARDALTDAHRRRAPRSGGLLLAGLLVVLAYAAFAHGTTGATAQIWLTLVLALGVVAVVGAWLWGGELRPRAPVLGWVGLLALAAFAAWTGLTLIWSVAPDRTWIELNRAIAYALVLFLAVVAGASDERAIERTALGYLGVATLVALYALGGKVAPGLHVAGVFDLNQTARFARLRAPLDYWNALAIVLVLATPIALRLVVDDDRSRRARIAALVALGLLIVVIGLTYSRGAILALVVALVVSLGLGGARLRSLVYLGMALLAATPPLAFAFLRPALRDNGVALGPRQDAGLLLALILVLALAALVGAAFVVLALERRTSPDPLRSRRIGRALLACLAVALVAGAVGVAHSHGGPGAAVSYEWRHFTRVQGADETDPGRLLSTSSSNRWVWWKEAVGAFSAKPLGGWGAGSFAVTHLLYRTNQTEVLQPHSVPLQLLAETGIVGALLALGALALLLAAAVRWVGRVQPGRERALAATLLAGVVAFVVHGLYEWDWDIPGVTLPALVLLGVLVGAAGRARSGGSGPVESPRLRGAALVAVTLLMCAVVLSAVLPGVAARKASAAQAAAAASRTAAQRRQAGAEAELAARLDPLSPEPLVAVATIAQRNGQLRRARRELLEAIGRQPDDAAAWLGLATLELRVRDGAAALRAIRRALALDPENRFTAPLAQFALDALTPPGDSATATGTPLASPPR